MPNQNPYSPSLSRSGSTASATAVADEPGDFFETIADTGTVPAPVAAATATGEPPRQRLEQRMGMAATKAPERQGDDLRAQVRSLALQVQALSEAAAKQGTRDRVVERAIGELRQRVHEVLLSTHRRGAIGDGTGEATATIPIKLVMAETAHAVHQAGRDVATHGGWSALFGGIFLGTIFATGLAIVGPYTIGFWIVLSVALFAFLVALVFAYLAQEARWRVRGAQRAMDESTVTRTLVES
ncbi:MAG: hypothetical protein NVS4B8_26590 [Herpetosiphon sp.]